MFYFFKFFFKFVTLLLYLLYKYPSTCIDHSKLPLIFYGFSRDNNSILDSVFSVKITNRNNLVCDDHLSVLVHKAELFHTKGDSRAPTTLSCTELLRSKCLDQKTCSIGVNDCNRLLEDKRVNIDFLNVEYTCEQSKVPSSSCQELIHPSATSVLGRKLKACFRSPTCKYVTSDDSKLHTAVCDRPVYVKANSFYELAKQANSSKQPTIVPMLGHVVAVPSRV
ncbi:conserved hypothetical protein [Theileria orientalis strain Shintoku]|uniref:SUEL-type lectin domain-containing protein n=1 Tax=Theileria orientalis strain Shintoku TaxID=869250 RepID=J4C989_THEOR|nr:conserved hypothetical protein [Theileria orientalis strain Shintoku]BAM42118.1 conserved hypothetical protein [Theileria orientalis strain Shintoku]|eukprot:XP_009692419.1 conserved hypothetical protein [Theileria orientalis strain Shintoku]